MAKNKLYTRSYAIKRLIENGFDIDIINIKFQDMRYWTVIVNPNKENIFLTCFLDRKNKTNFYFKLYSSLSTVTIKTKSMIILVDGIKNIIEQYNANSVL